MLRKIIFIMCTMLCFCLLDGGINNETVSATTSSIAEAADKPSIGLTPRELKKDRNFESSDLYSRAHHLIYGKKGPLGSDGRVRIAVVINGAEGLVVENRIKNQVYQQLRKKFPREEFAVMKGTDINTYLFTIAEEEKAHGLSDLRLNDYVNAGRKYDYDYVFIMTMTFGESRRYNHNFLPVVPYVISPLRGHTNKQNIWVKARFINVKNSEYVYHNDVVAMGSRHQGNFNGRVFEDGVKGAVQEIMDDIMVNDY